MRRYLYSVIIIIFVFVLGLVGKLKAQSDENITPSEESNTPHLNGHYFISLMNMPSAFIQSHFGMNLGIANSQGFETLTIEIDDEEIIGLKGSLVFADLNFDYRQKIKDWIAFNARIGVTARIGTEVMSLLTQGVNTVSSVRLGWNVKILERDKYLLTGTFAVNNYGVSYINIREFVEDIILDSTITSISKSVPILNGGLGLQFAYGFNELFGFQGHASALYGDSFERGDTGFIYHIGGVFDINLATTTKVPLGFSLGYTASTLPDIVQVQGKSATNTTLKIAFMGSSHYDMGLEISRLRVPLQGVEEKVRSTGVFITSKYYFN